MKSYGKLRNYVAGGGGKYKADEPVNSWSYGKEDLYMKHSGFLRVTSLILKRWQQTLSEALVEKHVDGLELYKERRDVLLARQEALLRVRQELPYSSHVLEALALVSDLLGEPERAAEAWCLRRWQPTPPMERRPPELARLEARMTGACGRLCATSRAAQTPACRGPDPR